MPPWPWPSQKPGTVFKRRRFLQRISAIPVCLSSLVSPISHHLTFFFLISSAGLKEASKVPFETSLTPSEIKSLENTTWEGRCQVISLPERSLKLYVDGAHTLESLAACTSWFRESVPPSAPRALVFNCSFDRNPARLLGPVYQLHAGHPFEEVVFSPNTPFSVSGGSSVDTVNHMAPPNPDLGFQNSLKQSWSGLSGLEATVVPSVDAALQLLATKRQTLETNSGEPLHVLITGSLHLVGATFNALKFVVR